MTDLAPAQAPVLAIVVPCYNEEQVLGETVKRLSAILTDLAQRGLISTLR